MINLKCVKCTDHCGVCVDSIGCTSCANGYFMKNNLCVQCGSQCLTCSNSVTCDTCPTTFYKNNFTCFSCTTCPNVTQCVQTGSCSQVNTT